MRPRGRGAHREAVLGVRARLLGLIVIPCFGLAVLGAEAVAVRSEQAADSEALVRGVDAAAEALDAHIAATEEYRLSNIATRAASFGLTAEQASGVIGLDLATHMAESRQRVDDNRTIDAILEDIGGRAALDRARATVDRGRTGGQQLLGVLLVRSEAAWTERVTALGALDTGPGDSRLSRALRTFEATAELFRAGADELVAAAAVAVPGASIEDRGDGSELAALSARYRSMLDRLLAETSGTFGATLRSFATDTSFQRAIRDLPRRAAAGLEVGELAAIFQDGLSRDAGLRHLTALAADEARSEALASGAAAEAEYRRIMFLVATLVAATLALALLVARSIVQPLSRLERRAAEISDGELDGDPIPAAGPREAAVLAQTLNDTVANLRAVERQAVALARGDAEGAAAVTAPGKLGALVGRSVEALATSIKERDQLQRRLAHEAAHDALTGLANRRTAMTRLDELLAGDEQVAVLFLDLDGFKLVNDEQGHAVGDALLTVAADRLRRCAPDDALVARIGGDEFVVATVVRDEAHALTLADRIAELLDEPVSIDGLPHRVAVSVGVAMNRPGDDADRLLRSADAALYEAKRAGRGRVVALDDALRADLEAQHRLEADLRVAIGADRLELHYQPLFETDGGRLHGVEALVRWRRDDGTLIPPDRFINLAERTGLVAELDRWVLGRALRQLARWRATKLPGLRLSVNASARTLLSSRFVDDVAAALRRCRVPGEALVVEVTETALLHDLDTAAARIGALRDLGVRTSVDDFGTGYTSVSHLRRLPVSEVKIDQSFVQAMSRDDRDRTLVDLVVRIGTVLALDVVAEGVETEDQLAEVRRLGCRLAQGYHLGMPMPAAELEAAYGATTGITEPAGS